MSRLSFSNFGKLADGVLDYTLASGRYKIQERAMRLVALDVATKLEISPDDSLLEIGSGLGGLSIPLSFFVQDVTLVDHPSCLHRFKERFPKSTNISFIEGNFLDVSLPKMYTKVLCYGVLQYLSSAEEVFALIDKSVAHLIKGGRALFGDFPNRSLKERFAETEKGRQFITAWQLKMEDEEEAGYPLDEDDLLVQCDDQLLLSILKAYRGKGYRTYILPQAADLPFGHTREDILITAFD